MLDALHIGPGIRVMYQRILLAYDGSESGQKALLGCQEIAQWSHAEMYLIAVMPSPAVYIAVDGGFYDSGRDEEDKQRFRAILDDGLRRLKDAGHTANGEMLVGDAVQEITEYAKKINADLIVVGHKHLKGWAARWWRGSTSASLIEASHCNVLVVITH
jgi:nucleotide-binding universal stress UspA family protein